MNPVISDPDNKINMSLDEIIRLTGGALNNRSRGIRRRKNKGKFSKNQNSDHSVPLLTSSEGVSVYVSKKSPLLNPTIKQSFLKAVTNRALNAELLNKTTRIIPAKYSLVKTGNGVERILVPVNDYVCKPLRKLHPKNHSDWKKTVPGNNQPLLPSPATKPAHLPNVFKKKFESKMEVDVVKSDDEDVIVLESIKKEPELIDVDMNMSVSGSLNNQLPVETVKTLNDRFTRLIESFQF